MQTPQQPDKQKEYFDKGLFVISESDVALSSEYAFITVHSIIYANCWTKIKSSRTTDSNWYLLQVLKKP